MIYSRVFIIWLATFSYLTSHSIHCKPTTLSLIENDCDESGVDSCPSIRKFNSKFSTKALCELCYLALPIARSLVDSNRTKYFHGIASHLCEDLKITDSIVCNMAVSEYEVS